MEVVTKVEIKAALPKKDLLVWSGGLDSTAIFFDCFNARKPIDIIYFDLRNNYVKGKAELIARDRIKQILKINFPDAAEYLASIKDRVYEIKEVHPTHNGMVTYWQPFLWLTSVIQNIRTEVEYENILMGYVQKDDFWHIRREFEAAYKNLQFMVNPHTEEYFSGEKIKWPALRYPYEWTDKQSIINNLSNDRVGSLILNQVWFCENPENETFEFKPCGHCNPCRAWAKLEKPAPTQSEGIEKQVTIDDVATVIDKMGDPSKKAEVHRKLQDYLDSAVGKPVLNAVDISGMSKEEIEKIAEPLAPCYPWHSTEADKTPEVAHGNQQESSTESTPNRD